MNIKVVPGVDTNGVNWLDMICRGRDSKLDTKNYKAKAQFNTYLLAIKMKFYTVSTTKKIQFLTYFCKK